MARRLIDIGVEGNDGTGDSIRNAFDKVNNNFQELYAVFGQGAQISITNLDDFPDTLTPNTIPIVNDTGTQVLLKSIAGEGGIQIDVTDNNVLTIRNTASSLSSDLNPLLSAPVRSFGVLAYDDIVASKMLSEAGRTIGPESLLSLYQTTHPTDTAITQDNFLVTKGFTDQEYLNVSGDSMTGALISRPEPVTADTLNPDYDASLTSNYLSTEVMQRKDAVYRGGDTLSGALYLHDHPGELEGSGSPNGIDDLQAATKYYVDNTSFASTTNLYVSTNGDDLQTTTPFGKEGRAWAYAYRSVAKACEKAEELMEASPVVPGPYVQTITYNNGENNSTVQSVGFESASGNTNALTLLENNKEFIQKEVVGYIQATYPDFAFDSLLCERDIGLIIDAMLVDIESGSNANSLSILAAKKYFSNPSAIKAARLQQTQTLDAIAYARTLVSNIFNNTEITTVYQTPSTPGDPSTVPFPQFIGTTPAETIADDQVTDNTSGLFAIILDIIENGLSAIPAIVEGSDYQIEFTNDGSSVDQGRATTGGISRTDIIPGKVVRGKTSGAIGQITRFERNAEVNLDRISMKLLSPVRFEINEELEYGNYVKLGQITIHVESGEYYEQFPIRVPENVSIKGDEFRRVIIKPASGVSTSLWNKIYFFRNKVFDGIRLSSYVGADLATATTATPSSASGDIVITFGGPAQSSWVGGFLAGNGGEAYITSIDGNTANAQVLVPFDSSATIADGNWTVYQTEEYGYHYLSDPRDINSTPLRNDQIDAFLMNDSTIMRNVTVSGHGGFMEVLDPEGQILTRSPYTQTCSSFSKGQTTKVNKHFRGGMYVDGYTGNLRVTLSAKTDNFTLSITSLPGQGLFIRKPNTPAPFFLNGQRYQVNAITNYDQSAGTATFILDESSPYADAVPGGGQDIIMQTAGNRSMLGNDYTQVNDLGYGLVCNNGALSEQVSTFTYYCHTGYFANNGSEIRSLNGSNAYGNYGLVSEGRDPTEIPIDVSLTDDMVHPFRVYQVEAELTFAASQTVNAGDTITQDQGGGVIVTGTSAFDTTGTIVYVENITGGTFNTTDPITELSATPSSVDYVNYNNDQDNLFIYVYDLPVPPLNVSDIELYHPSENLFNVYEIVGGSEVNDATVPAGNFTVSSQVYRLGLGTGVENIAVNGLRASTPTYDVTLNKPTYGTLRNKQNLKLQFASEAVLDTITARPSTALTFDESTIATYRTISFEKDQTDPSQATVSIDAPYRSINLLVRMTAGANEASNADVTGSGSTTMGATAGDTVLAINTLTLSEAGRLADGNMLFGWDGKVHRITSYQDQGSYATITFEDVSDLTGSGTPGLNSPVTVGTAQIRLQTALDTGTTGEISRKISLLRANGHDFKDIGTGGYNSSNYPLQIYGIPEESIVTSNAAVDSNGVNPKAQVQERNVGRVFFASTDQDGFFRVGRFFTVDQGKGSVTFNAAIVLTGLNGIQFREGVYVDEFTNDATFFDPSSSAVPTQFAVQKYLDYRLGQSEDGTLYTTEKIGPGFMALDGSAEMLDDMDMGGNIIQNLSAPRANSGTDAANKNYVDERVNNSQYLENNYNLEINAATKDDILIATGNKRLFIENVSSAFVPGDSITGSITGATGTVVDYQTGFITPSGSVYAILTYEPLTGNFTSSDIVETNPGGAGNKTAQITEINNAPYGPLDEFANASEDGSGDVTFNVTRTQSGATYRMELKPEIIDNANVATNAGIVQSKLDLDFAQALASAVTGTDSQIQASLGLASFDSSNFEVTNGWVGIKDGGVAFSELPVIANNSVIGRTASGAGAPTDVAMKDAITSGMSDLASDAGITTAESLVAVTYVASPTPTRDTTVIPISTSGTGNSIVKTQADGSIRVESIRLGGNNDYEILSLNSTTLEIKTPGQGIVLTSNGTLKPTMETGGNIVVGDLAANSADNSAFKTASAYNTEVSALASRWIYTSFIEGVNEKDATGTGIGIGNGTGFVGSANDVIQLISNGSNKLQVTSTEVTINDDIVTNGASLEQRYTDGSAAGITHNYYKNSTSPANGDDIAIVNFDANDSLGNRTTFARVIAESLDVVDATEDGRYSIFTAVNGSLAEAVRIDNSGVTILSNTILGNATSDTVTFNARLNSNVLPVTNNNINLGGAALRWNTVYATTFDGTATRARYADLAENYLGDAEYEPGTVLIFGGDQEVTITNVKGDRKVAGVVTTNPAHLMNSHLKGEHVVGIALQGRVPCKVLGKVQKGDILVTSAIPGFAIVDNNPQVGTVIGKAVGEKNDNGKGIVEVVVGRV